MIGFIQQNALPRRCRVIKISVSHGLDVVRGAAAPGAGPERRLVQENLDERDLRRPPHPMVQFICVQSTPERRNLNGRGRRCPGAGKATMGDDWSRKIAMDPTQWWYGMDRDHPLG